jgi:hypothetical protein
VILFGERSLLRALSEYASLKAYPLVASGLCRSEIPRCSSRQPYRGVLFLSFGSTGGTGQ